MKIDKGTTTRAVVTAIAMLSAAGASAAPVTGDFREELSIPSFAAEVRVLQRLAEPIAGTPDLTGANQVSNPRGYTGELDADLSVAGLLTLTGRSEFGFDSYERIVFTITNLIFDFAGQTVTGFTMVGNSGLFGAGGANPAPVIGSTANSLTVTYATTDPNGFFIADGGTATFQAAFSAVPQAVPEPATGVLLAMGLAAGLVVPRRKSKQA